MLQEPHFETADDLLAGRMDLTSTIEKVTLQRVFLDWMDRPAKCISTNDDDLGGDEYKVTDWEYFIG
jgi:hypothetical protein